MTSHTLGGPRPSVAEAHLEEVFYALLDEVEPPLALAIEENVIDQRIALTDRLARCRR